ncbi:MAG: transporter related protein, partial [Solirubrobacterales bacterium]|nr:transporter related protein [Solirubrobacterales bacterium]
PAAEAPPARPIARLLAGRRRARGAAAALEMKGVWHELRDGPAVLRGVDLRIEAGETVALMGRNGAGKSTLLRHAAGLLKPTRGSVRSGGRVALLLQNPGDYLLHERVAEEAPSDALAAAGLADLAERHPRDLSGGERQRLALAVVLGDGTEAPAVLALDEPTRGMDRLAKQELAHGLRERAAEGLAVIVATHDAEFAAALATRAVLLADGRPIADGAIEEILAGGWYFATETARVLGGAGGALLPEQGAELLRGARAAPAVLTSERLAAGL